jgi:hypothetical protein
MKTINCTAKLLPDGYLLLPPDVLKKIKKKKNAAHRIIILNTDTPKKGLSRFCGRWKDDRDADEIVSEIFKDRIDNNRSDRINL